MPDSNQPGGYAIIPSGGTFAVGDANSYAIQYENGVLTIQSASVSSYLVTVNGGTGGASYQAENTVTVTAEAREGYTFKSWSAK